MKTLELNVVHSSGLWDSDGMTSSVYIRETRGHGRFRLEGWEECFHDLNLHFDTVCRLGQLGNLLRSGLAVDCVGVFI